MIFNWFNARQAVEVGASLANYVAPTYERRARGGRDTGGSRLNIQGLLQRATKEAGELKLNLYRRARLLSSFKYTLLEHGVDQKITDELTRLLTVQLFGRRAPTEFAASFQFRGRAAERGNGLAGTRGRHSRTGSGLIAEADAHYAKGAYAKTVESLLEALKIEPDNALARDRLGAALCNLGRYRLAEQEFRRATELDRRLAGPHLNLGTLLFSRGDFAASETALRRAVKLDPKNAEALAGLGFTLGALQRVMEADDCFQRALRLKPSNASARCGLGWLAAFAGRFDEAERLYREALAVDSQKAFALAAISGLRRMTAADGSWLDAVERTLAGGVPLVEEGKLRFAMGKYFDDRGSFPKAFAQYRRANESYKELAAPYDRRARAAFVDDMVKVYTRQVLAEPLEGSSDSPTPILVVGMMRSGTSLVEQIIASHSCAVGAGELDFWNNATYKNREVLRGEVPNPSLARKLADSYSKILKQRSADALRVVDKSTVNSDHLGLIHLVFPRAKIIYLRRDPVDSCLSCYFQDFANAASFTFDLSDLAHYYCEHHRLMTHWRSALPAGALLDVHYAELVADQESWSRRIMEFIGLEWEPRCLEFHKTERPVLTASNWQVRQPMYSSSVGRWRNYEKYIGPLLELRKLA